MKIVTLGENPRVIFENVDASSKKLLMEEALHYGITDYTEADLTGWDLENLSFFNCIFNRARFERTRLQHTVFDTCVMSEAIFKDCPTYLTRMRSCNLDNAVIEQTHMGNVEMFMCTLRGANLVNLGMTAKGYTVVMSFERGIAIIRAGCQELTLEEAKKQYPETRNDEEGARVTLARRIAYQRGWLYDKKAEGVVVEEIKPEEMAQSFEELVKEDQAIMGIRPPDELPDEDTKEVTQAVNA